MKTEYLQPPHPDIGCRMLKSGVRDRNDFLTVVGYLLLSALTFTATGYSSPLQANLLNTQYTTDVNIARSIPPWLGGGATNHSHTTISAISIGDSMFNPVSGLLSAEANAGLFAISAFTEAENYGNDPLSVGAGASAKSEFWFSPLSSQTAILCLQFSGWHSWYWSDGYVSLLDVTANQTLWNYSWEPLGHGTVPWADTGGDPRATAALALNTYFDAGHAYQFCMYTRTGANPADRERILVQLSGLEIVPEPSTIGLLGLGSLALARARRRR